MPTTGARHSFSHTVRMLIGCILPFLVIFLLPVFGLPQGTSTLIFIILMFGCHVMMMGRHGHSGHQGHRSNHDTERMEEDQAKQRRGQ